MPFIHRPNATVAYDVVGSGPPVILGHSLFCTRSMWAGVVEELESDYTLVNVELRGHGESTAEGPFSLDDLVDDWLAILDQESIERALLCGLSTGGMTAMRLVLKAPDRVSGMALLDTNAGAEPVPNRIQYGMLAWMYRNFGVLPRATLMKAMYSPDTIENRPEIISGFLEQARGFNPRHLGRTMRAVFGRNSVDVGPVRVPTLVIVGEHDHATPPGCARSIADAISGARLEVVPGAGHLTVEERPTLVAGLLRGFFESCLG